MAQKRRKPRPTVATKAEFLNDINHLENTADYAYRMWHSRADDHCFFMIFDRSVPMSRNMADSLADDCRERRAQVTVRGPSGREWQIALVDDSVMDRFRAMTHLETMRALCAWFDRVKLARPRFVPVIGWSSVSGPHTRMWNKIYEPDLGLDTTPSVN